MPIDFPNSPAVDETFTSAGKTWKWNGTSWILMSIAQTQTTASGGLNTTTEGAITIMDIGV